MHTAYALRKEGVVVAVCVLLQAMPRPARAARGPRAEGAGRNVFLTARGAGERSSDRESPIQPAPLAPRPCALRQRALALTLTAVPAALALPYCPYLRWRPLRNASRNKQTALGARCPIRKLRPPSSMRPRGCHPAPSHATHERDQIASRRSRSRRLAQLRPSLPPLLCARQRRTATATLATAIMEDAKPTQAQLAQPRPAEKHRRRGAVSHLTSPGAAGGSQWPDASPPHLHPSIRDPPPASAARRAHAD